MPLLRSLPLLLLSLGPWAGAAAGAESVPPPRVARNLFHELLGGTEAELDHRIAAAWQQLFHGNHDTQRVYFPVGTDQAYIADIGNGDVRSEGMSYGMMIAAQLDKKAELDCLWQWACTHMRHQRGPRRGFFAWHCRFDGSQIDPGSASDGEEWFVMALFFASHRWGDGPGIFNYRAEARALLREMLHKPAVEGVTPMFHRGERQVVFVPTPVGFRFTDPSYHLPAFYELWARWAEAPADRQFWHEAAATSRAFFQRASHPLTGLMPDYADFDGRPHRTLNRDKGDFRFDAWRTLANVGLDYAWWRVDPWQVEQGNRVLRFLQSHAPAIPNQFTLEGKPLSKNVSPGLIAMAAVAGHAADPDLARPFVRRLWEASIPVGKWRYYDGLLYLLGLLQAGGRFQVHAPPSR